MGIGGYIGAWFGIDFLLIAHVLTMISGKPIDVSVELCYRGCYSCIYLPSYQELSHS
jgi:hypothetical protein